MKRLTLSKLSIAEHCTYWLRDEVPLEKFKETWATRLGNAIHEACEVYPNPPDFDALSVKFKDTKPDSSFRKHMEGRYARWKTWADSNFAPTWRVELSLAYDPLTGAARILEGRFPATEPGEIMGRLDMIDPDNAHLRDWKFGSQPVALPANNPQIYASGVIAARAFDLPRISAGIVQVNDDGLIAPVHTFEADELAECAERLTAVALRIVPDAEPVPGSHCLWCAAKAACPAYAEMKTQKPIVQEEVSVATPIKAAPAAGRMSLSEGTDGIIEAPLRLIVYGPEKVGKSTFAASFPKSRWLSAEKGTRRLKISRFHVPESWADVHAAMDALLTEKHDFQTFVVDPLGWVEPLLMAEVCKRFGWATAEEAPYGRAFKEALPYWKEFVDKLERLGDDRGMHVVLVAHSEVKQQKAPDVDDYERYQLALGQRAAAMLKQWADMIGFMRHEVSTKKVGLRVKGIGGEEYVMHTRWAAAWDAGNRFNLPAEIVDPTFAKLQRCIQLGAAEVEEVTADIRALIAAINQPDVTEKAERWVTEAEGQIGPLLEVLEGLRAKQEETKAA